MIYRAIPICKPITFRICNAQTMKFIKRNIKKLPEGPGVYVFHKKNNLPITAFKRTTGSKPVGELNADMSFSSGGCSAKGGTGDPASRGGEDVIYVGKANNLRRRVGSYLSVNLAAKTSQMVSDVDTFSTIQVGSELEALLLEAHLVKKFQPKYNISLKDDKHALYIKITNEKYPRVQTARKVEEQGKNILFIGPFPSSQSVYEVLKLLRKIFPFAHHSIGKRVCLYAQIGLCSPCPSNIEKLADENEKKILRAKYRKNIRLIKKVLAGQLAYVRNSLEKDMKQKAAKQEFEKAIIVRNQIQKLDYITQPITPIKNFLKNPNLIEDIRDEEVRQLKKLLAEQIFVPKVLRRIECYDVAHISGKFPTASMVTFINAQPEKKFYRHFKIRQKRGASDTDSLSEVAKRRRKYLKSWGRPDLIIVDGGKGQVSSFTKTFASENIAVVGIAKRTESLIIPVAGDGKKYKQIRLLRGPALFLVQRLRDESHRFARKYHHKLLNKNLITKARMPP